MAKINANYEVLYIIDPNLSEEATAELVAKFKELVETKGAVTEVDEWVEVVIADGKKGWTERKNIEEI